MKKILYCDDDPDFLANISMYLVWYGYHADAILDPGPIVGYLEEHSYDLLILSLWTQPLSGFDVINQIRNSRNEKVRNQKVLLIAPEQLDDAQFRKLKEQDIFFMTKYRGAEKWNGKIKAVLRARGES